MFPSAAAAKNLVLFLAPKKNKPSPLTKKDAPTVAKSASLTAAKKRRGRGSLRIPLTSSGLTGSGIQFPTT